LLFFLQRSLSESRSRARSAFFSLCEHTDEAPN
jgi:hypothetical protein